MHRIIFALSLGLGLVAAGPVSAANAGFLANAPISYFTDDDVDLALATASDALNNAADRESRSWVNPENGNTGTYTPLASARKGEKDCRSLQVEHSAPKVSASSRFLVCKQADGSWNLE